MAVEAGGMEALAKQIEQDVERLTPSFVGAVTKWSWHTHKRLTEMAPVDTGEYLANMQLGTDNDGSIIPWKLKRERAGGSREFNRSKAMSMAIANRVAFRYKNHVGSDVLFFNNVRHAAILESGHSQQAPHGIFSQVFSETELSWNNFFNIEVRETGVWS